MSHLDEAARHAVGWFRGLALEGIDLTSNAHLKVEHEAQEFADTPTVEEAADVVIAVLGALHQQGLGIEDLAAAMITKIAINRNRTWARTADGTYQHVS